MNNISLINSFFIMSCLLLAFLAFPALAAKTPKATVLELNHGIQADDPKVLKRAIDQSFDLHRVAIQSVGVRRWRQWSTDEQNTYRKVFIDYMIALYLNRFRDYEGGGLDIYKVEQQKNQARVRARIAPEVDKQTLASTAPIKIDFVLLKNKKKNDWQIIDVYFKGTISEVAGFRAQFSQLARDEGWASLIRVMKAKKKDFATKNKN